MTTENWQELATISHYQTAVAVEEALKRGDTTEAAVGIQELVDALSRADRRALRSQLIRLMLHIIKWRTQPERRCRSWSGSIGNARREIAGLREDTPSLTREVIEEMWASCFAAATEDAEAEIDATSKVEALTWEDAFEDEYRLPKKQ